MEIRKITRDEIETAGKLLLYVHDTCVREQFTQEQDAWFQEYASVENLTTLTDAGQLILWGLWDKVPVKTEYGSRMAEYLLAVGAMTLQGQITLLHVHPKCRNRKYASKLLAEMRRYGGTELSLDKVWANVTPASACGYFEKKAFSRIDRNQSPDGNFLSYAAKTTYLKYYPRKYMPKWAVALLVGASVLLSFLLGLGYMVYTIF